MKKLIFALLIAFVLVAQPGFAQHSSDSSRVKSTYSPWRFGINTGVSVGSFQDFNRQNQGFFSTFMEGTANYYLSPRAGLIFGLGYERFNFNAPVIASETSVFPVFGSQNTYTVSGGGFYHINDKVTLSGLMQYSIPEKNNFGNPYGFNNDFKSYQLNIDYKVTDNFSIGAGVRYSEGYRMGNFASPVGYNTGYPYNNFW